MRFDEATLEARAGVNRRRGARTRGPNRLQQRKQVEIDRLLAEGIERIGQLSDRDLLIAGTALYAGEDRHSRDPVRQALPGGARSEHPPLEASAGVPGGVLRVVRYPPGDHGARPCAVTLRGLQSGVAQLVEQSAVNRKVCGFDPHPRSSRARRSHTLVKAGS